MPYIGNTPADKFLTLAKQNFSTSATTSYTLDSSVSSTQDIALFINNVRQSPVDAYTVSGTALTLTSATAGTDEMYCVYLGKTVGTVSPASDSVTTAMIQSNAVNNAKMADDAIGLAELSATGTASSSTFLRGDNSWASAGGNNTPSFCAYASAVQNINHATATKVTLGGEEIDSDGKFADSRFTPTVAGTYFIIATLGTNDAELDRTECHIYMNGTSVTKSSCGGSGSAQLDNMTVTNSCLITLDTDDYIELYAYAETTDSSTILIANDSGGASRIRTGLMGFKLI